MSAETEIAAALSAATRVGARYADQQAAHATIVLARRTAATAPQIRARYLVSAARRLQAAALLPVVLPCSQRSEYVRTNVSDLVGPCREA